MICKHDLKKNIEKMKKNAIFCWQNETATFNVQNHEHTVTDLSRASRVGSRLKSRSAIWWLKCKLHETRTPWSVYPVKPCFRVNFAFWLGFTGLLGLLARARQFQPLKYDILAKPPCKNSKTLFYINPPITSNCVQFSPQLLLSRVCLLKNKQPAKSIWSFFFSCCLYYWFFSH